MATAKKISHEFTGNPSKRDSYEPRPGYKQRGVDHGKAPKKYTRRYGKALKKSRGIAGRLLRNQGREYRKGAHVNKMFIEPGTGKVKEMHRETLIDKVEKLFTEPHLPDGRKSPPYIDPRLRKKEEKQNKRWNSPMPMPNPRGPKRKKLPSIRLRGDKTA